ncbi:murein biosynthesis integral membrane protein MurJ [Pseudomonas sp. 2FE]|uniref:murein biosynthesis integral membrane protein MurJ n=1 Tax=Pseudomonas sp. 2FE TaxID=2502190 RepID=UPI0010F6DAFC|nr:lipid II flippase MurJ [Pseudomonas sp. 2FE]
MSKYWKWFLIVGLIVLGKLSGFLKDVMITFYHGVSPITDAYFLSGSIASLLYMAVYSSIPVLVVPLYSRLRTSELRVAVDKNLTAALSFFLAFSLALAAFVLCAAPYLVDLFAGSVEGGVRGLAIDYLSIMSVTFALSTVVAFYNSVQTVNNSAVPSYVVPVVNNSFFCIGLVLFSAGNDFYKILVLGIFAWLALLFMNYRTVRPWFSLYPKSFFAFFKDKSFLLLLLPAAISFYIEQANGFVGVYFATELGAGAISVFGYSNKLSMIFLSVFLVFLTASLFPKIAAIASQGDKEELAGFVLDCVRAVIILGIPVVLFMIFYSREIVSLLFKRGNFLDEDVLRVSSVFAVVLLALPFSLVRDIMNRVYFSHNNTLIPVLLSVTALLINVSLSYALYREYALTGLAAATVASIVFNSVFIVFLVQRKINFNLILPMLKVIALCGVAAGCSYFLLTWLDGHLSRYWLILFCPFSLAYFLILYFFRVREAVLITSVAKSFFRKA